MAIAIFAVLGIVFFAITRERIYLLSAAPPLAFDLIFFGISEPRMFPSLAIPPFDATWTITHVIFFVAQWAFMRAFLELPASAKIVDRCFTGLLVALVLTYLVGDFGPYDGSRAEAFAELAFYAAPLAGAVIAIRRGSRRARFFIAGTALVALSVIDVSLMDAGITWIPQPVAHWVGLLAIPIESLLFFIGIADRLRRTILERERALAESDAAKTELVASQQHHIDEIERRNVSFARFVPRAFLEQLSRDDVSQVSLGDHCERAMSVLFSDIRGFTTLSERLSPAETFSFLNSYLARAGPVIRESAGFVDKYIGDAIMALFPRDPSDAVDAALKLQREVRQFNDVRARHGGKPIAIGIGINYGDLMLGTIGETERYETTVLSDAVNIASRLEGLSKLYGAGIIAGGGLVKALPDAHHYHLRHLGTVLLKGLTQTVEAYEIFDGDASDLLLHKAATLERFEAGLAAYRRGAFDESSDIFSAIARAHREDRAAAWLRDRSAALATTLDLTWDGIDRLETK
jgi:class 3 adenylate cyclase